MISLVALDNLILPIETDSRGRMTATPDPRHAALAQRPGRRRVSASPRADFRQHRRACCTTTSASRSARPRRRWSIRAWPSGCARSAYAASATTASSSARPRGLERAARHGRGAHHQRHPLLPRAASFRPLPNAPAAGAGRPRAAGRASAAVVGGLLLAARSPIRWR